MGDAAIAGPAPRAAIDRMHEQPLVLPRVTNVDGPGALDVLITEGEHGYTFDHALPT